MDNDGEEVFVWLPRPSACVSPEAMQAPLSRLKEWLGKLLIICELAQDLRDGLVAQALLPVPGCCHAIEYSAQGRVPAVWLLPRSRTRRTGKSACATRTVRTLAARPERC